MDRNFVSVIFCLSTNGAFSNTGKRYIFACYDDVKEDDVVVVDTQYGYQLAKVVETNADFDSVRMSNDVIIKEVVCKVDFSAFNERAERAKKKKSLEEKMKKRFKELEKTELYKMMAEKDETMRTMLEEYQSLI